MKQSDIEREFTAGERILASGSTARELFVVRRGRVRIEREPDRYLGPGEVFGELAAVLGVPEPFGVIAESQVSVLVLGARELTRLCEERGEFSIRLIQHLAQELQHARGGPGPVGRAPAGLARMASVLLDSAAGPNEPEAPASVPLDLRGLARACDLSLDQAYACVHRLFDARTLRLEHGRLSLVDPGGLRELASESLSRA